MEAARVCLLAYNQISTAARAMSDDIGTRPAPVPGTRIAYGPEPLQFGDLRLPGGTGPFPLVVGIHGGYWRSRYGLEWFAHACAALAAVGYATWNIEYRRLGNDGGGWPGTLLDVRSAADFARTLAGSYPLDLDKVIAVGHSAGGHLAAWLASRHRIAPQIPLHTADPIRLRGMVAIAGVLDLRQAWELRLSGGVVNQLLGGTPEEHPDRYAAASPAALLPLGVRQILIHGTADTNVPYAVSKDYYARARALGDDVELMILEGAGHFEPVDPETLEWQSVVEAMRAVLT
jgi:acetyl esterase/lipase